ncbi:MAG: hypothetical protein NTX63_01180 [Candidatus Peregrinibacteria bacterium]|nr:hypothetical protein [Candidatus Peregrinibacteria bacterium]
MNNWYTHQLLKCLKAENVLFTGRRAFFAAGSSGSGSGGKSTDDDESLKKPATPLDVMTDSMGNKIMGSLNSTNADDLMKNLNKMKSDGKLSTGNYEKAKRLAKSGMFMDRTLALRLTQGSITSYRFNKLYECSHEPKGDGNEPLFRRDLAEHELTGRISPSDFDITLSALDSNSDKHKNAAKEFIRNPKSAKDFRNFMKENPLNEKKALHDIAGVSAFDSEEDRFRKSLTEFVGVEAQDYLSSKIDSPEDAEKVRAMIKEFGEASKSHLDSWGELTNKTKESVAKGDPKIEKAIDIMLSESFGDAIRKSEKPINREDIKRGMAEAREKTGVDLSRLIPEDTMRHIEERLRFLQDIQIKIGKNYDAITIKELAPRMEETMKRISLKQNIVACSKQSGINLKPGTKIQYMMEVLRDDKTIERKWVTTEVQGVYLDKPTGEKIEWNGEMFDVENMPLVVVTGAGRETFGRFKKWVVDTQAHQIIDGKGELDNEIQFDAMKLPIKEGMELEYEIKKGEGSETNMAKIAKIHPDGFIELDRDVNVVYPENGTVAGQMLTNPIGKKRLTYGEFAQWIKRFGVVPHLKTNTEAQEAYNNWKAIHGNPGAAPVNFQKGGQLSYGPIEQKNVLTVREITKGDDVEMTRISRASYRPAELLRHAMSANWRSNDPLVVATAATAMIPESKRIEARDRYAKRLERELDEIADMQELEEEEHALHDAHAKEDAHGAHAVPALTPEEAQQKDWMDAEAAKQKANVTIPHEGTIMHIWNETQFISAQDVGELGKHIWEYWNRTWERRMKNRFAKFGSHLPFIGTEMLRIKEDTEHEEVGKFKHAMEHMGDFEIRGLLNGSSNQDQIKACIEVLTEKGMMRWDDVRTWKAINRIPALSNDKKIPIPNDGNAYAIVGMSESGIPKKGMDYLKEAFENIWGDDNLYDSWRAKNKGAYKSGLDKYKSDAAALENDPNGLSGGMKMLLSEHMRGNQVDPQKYEEFIRYAIEEGKSNAENRLYYIVMGVATNLLTLDRVADLNGLCNKQPWLDFFTQAKDENKPLTLTTMQSQVPPYYNRTFTVSDFKVMANFFDNDSDTSKKKFGPGKNVHDFFWKKIMPHHTTQTRTLKASRGAEGMDHDDAHFFMPCLDYRQVRNMCGSSAGDKKYFSPPGYLNVFPGFSEWSRTLAATKNRTLLEKAILSYVNFDGIITGRFLKSDTKKQVISDNVLENDGSVVDPLTPSKFHIDQMRNMILKIGAKAERGDRWKLLFKKIEKASEDKDGKGQKEIENFIEEFGPELNSAINSIGEEELFKIVNSCNLKGYSGTPDPVLVARAKAKAAAQAEAGGE